MTGIVCFELIPEAIRISNILQVILGILLGVIVMIGCDLFLNRKYDRYRLSEKNTNSLLKTGTIIGIGLALHNFPEGLVPYVVQLKKYNLKLEHRLFQEIWSSPFYLHISNLSVAKIK